MSRTLQFLCAALLAVALVAGMGAPRQSALSAADPSPAADPAKPAKVEAAEAEAEKGEPSEGLRAGKEAIEEALAETVSCEFEATPLVDVVSYLSDHQRVNIVIDKKALDDNGIETATPITKKLSNVTLRSAMNLLLRDVNLAWTIQDEVLTITTPEQAESILSTEVHDVADLVTCRDDKNELWEDYETLVDAIVTTVRPSTWEASGGPAALRGATFGSAKVLIVTQTHEGHDQVVALLEKLRGAAQKNGAKPQPPRRTRPAPAT
jgi:hypothetical protein